MPNKPVLIHLIVWILFQIQNIYTFKDDEHYCQGAFDSYSYCRRCPNSTMFCEAPKSCHCDDIEIFSDHPHPTNEDEVIGYQGGAICDGYDVPSKRRWCYVSEKSICSDKQLSGLGKGVQDEWFNSNLYWSLDACDSNEIVNTGNELFLPSTRLTSKDLPTEYGGGGFNSTSPEGCQTECHVRLGKCGSWSFNMNTQMCYLHETDGCCDQFSKRVPENEYMSGYICPVCWSTRNQCPCTKDLRLTKFFAKFTSGGKLTENFSPTAKVGFVKRPNAYRRKIWRWNGYRWFRIRPTTHDSISNCNEQCQKRRNRRNKNIKNDDGLEQRTNGTCKTISGPQTNQECKFPVNFRGQKYKTCISGSKRRRPWCSTGLNANGEYVSKMWGYCNTSNCPLPEEA